MYRRILVPLDGSKLAECALPHAIDIAKAFSADIVLVTVTERVKGFRAVDDLSTPTRQRLVPEATGKLELQGRKYLDRIAKNLRAKGITVLTEVQLWEPADGIIISAIYNKCELIVMASHGRSGFNKWSHGSVAEKVFRVSNIPVLMVKAPGCETEQIT